MHHLRYDLAGKLGRQAELGLHSVPVGCRANKCSSHGNLTAALDAKNKQHNVFN